MEKTNYDYPTKAAARQKLANFIIRHYPDRKQRRELTYVCFPGFDDGSGTSLELTQVTDRVGIPRSNVYGIEYDGGVYKKLLVSRPGIKLFYGSDEEFFEKTDKKFDVISLDYTGQLTSRILELFRHHIFGRELLKSPSILHTNFYGSREHQNIKDVYLRPSKDPFASQYVELQDKISEETDMEKRQQLLELQHENANSIMKLLRDTMKQDLDLARDDISHVIMSYLLEGKLLVNVGQEVAENAGAWIETLRLEFEKRGVPKNLVNFFIMKNGYSYFCDQSERFSYVADDGSPMMTDLFFLNQHRELFDDKSYPVHVNLIESPCENQDNIRLELFDSVGKRYLLCPHSTFMIGGFLVGNPFNFDNPFIRKVISHTRVVQQKVDGSYNFPIREFLGSDAKPALTNSKLKQLVESGKDKEELQKNYRVSEEQLRKIPAFKAWKTMRERE